MSSSFYSNLFLNFEIVFAYLKKYIKRTTKEKKIGQRRSNTIGNMAVKEKAVDL